MENVEEEKVKRKRKRDSNRRFRVTIRFTETEFNALQEKAGDTATGELAGYIREVLARKKVEHFYRNRSMDDWVGELSRLRRELNALGNNFNQVVKKINATGGQNEFAYWLQESQKMQVKLLARVASIQEKIDQFASQWFAKSSQATPSDGR